MASLGLVALLFLVLPAPQFADDKGILALVVMLACGLRLAASLFSKTQSYKANAVDALVLAFLGLNVVSAASSFYFAESLKGLAKMLVFFSSYFLFISVLQKSSLKRSLIVISTMLFAAGLVAAYGVYQYKTGVAALATWEDPNVLEKTTRVYSTLKNPNLLAGYLVPLIPLSFSLAIAAFFQKGWLRAISLPMLALGGLLSICCVFTGSRGGYMGIAAGIACLGLVIIRYIWGTKPKLKPLIIGILFFLPLGLALLLHHFPRYEHRIISIFAGWQHSSNAYRLNVYISSFKMFLDNWWLGIGPGNSTFKLVYGLYMKSGFDALGTYCVPLEVAVETGIVGLLAFSWLVIACLSRAHENFWTKDGSPSRWIFAGSAAGLLAMMVHGLVDTVFYRPQVQFIFWLLLALCICNSRKAEQTEIASEGTNNSNSASVTK